MWAGMVVWSGAPVPHRPPELHELPRRSVRPREHGAGGVEHGARPSARGHRGGDRASRWCGSVLTSIRSSSLLAPLWLVWPLPARARVRADRGRVARSAARLLARSSASRLGERRGSARTGVSRVPVDGDERERRDPSRDVRDPVLPLLHLVPRHRAAVAVRAVRARSRCRRASSWVLPIAALGVWYALAHGKRRDGRAIALLGAAWTFVAIYFVVPSVRRRDDSMFFGFYDDVGGSPGRRRAARSSRIPARSSGRSSRGTTSRT